jgi:ketosteroid isomerase-like protein
MSQENVEIVRSAYERFNAGEREPSPELWHLDAEYISDRRDPDPATYRGLAAIARVFRSWVDAYPDLRVEPLEIRASGHRVFVWTRFSGHGAGSEVPIDMERAQVWTVEDAKIRQAEEYFDSDEALEAAGLRE